VTFQRRLVNDLTNYCL